MKVHLLDDQINEMTDTSGKTRFNEMFKLDQIADGTANNELRNLGGSSGIAKMFDIDLKVGITSAEKVLEQRRMYGTNNPVKQNLTPLYKLIIECLGDTMLQILIVAAIASTIIGVISDPSEGWYEGVAILFAIVLIVSVTSGNNYFKEREFAKLQSKLDDMTLQVKRNGDIIQVNCKEVVVGDVLIFNLGDVFNVDGIFPYQVGIFLHGNEVKIDESAMTGESDEIVKISCEHLDQPSEKIRTPFLISGTKVVDGSGSMLVLRVGEFTVQGEMKKLVITENSPTPLQVKLESVAEDIGKVGILVALVTFLILIIRMLIEISSETNDQDSYWDLLFSMDKLRKVIEFFMIGVTIICVAVPEGLPLAVTITLAYSVNKMKDEQNLVKVLASCEIMGGATTVCSDKTGTLTQNVMTVTSIWANGQKYKDQEVTKLGQQNKSLVDEFANSVLYNSNAYPKRKATGGFEQTGNKTECALIQYFDQIGYQLNQYRPSDKIVRVVPFNSSRKKMMTIVEKDGQLTLYSKGASEMVLEKCTQIYGNDGVRQLKNQERDEIVVNVIESFAREALRTIAVAYKALERVQDVEHITEDELDRDLILLGIAGIQDPIRPDVPAAIKQCERSGIRVRMVTGDNVLTARAIAKNCGILKAEPQLYEVLEGKEFRTLVGGLQSREEDGTTVYYVQDMRVFRQIADKLKVLARASPQDKYLLVTGLKDMDEVVAVTGDGTNDAPALKKADVGFAMGIAGSDVAKEAADIILIDDNFSSIITACKWGRNIYNCIRKFIQFQLTVNVVALFMSVLGSSVLAEAPLTSIQMLWVNLIMDTFAALALATEPPSQKLLDRRPYGKKDPIVNAYMYRFIVTQALYQIAVLCFLLFAPIETITLNSFDFDDAELSEQKTRKTIFFQSFVLMCIFSAISARKLDDASYNPFKDLGNNTLFWIIQFIEFAIQYLIVIFGGEFVNVVSLTWQDHLLAFIFGISGIIFATLFRFVPVQWFRKFNIFNEEQVKEEDMDNTITSKLRRTSSIRLGNSVISDTEEEKTLKRKKSKIY